MIAYYNYLRCTGCTAPCSTCCMTVPAKTILYDTGKPSKPKRNLMAWGGKFGERRDHATRKAR